MFEEDVKNIQYHTCYANYRKKKEELNLKQYSHSSFSKQRITCSLPTFSRAKSSKTVNAPMPHEKSCFFCSQIKRRGDIQKSRIYKNAASKAVPFQLHDCRDTLGAETLAIFAKV